MNAPDGKSTAELVRFHPDLPAALSLTAPEASLRLEDWPVAPAVRQPVSLTRHDVYAPDARLVAIVAGLQLDGRERHLPHLLPPRPLM